MSHDLVEMICNAFPLAPLPPRPITPHRCPECDDIDQLIGGLPWSKVVADLPGYWLDAFPLLSRPAMHYYLPAWMIYDIQEPGEMPGISITAALERGDVTPGEMTPLQIAAVRGWIEASEEAASSPAHARLLAAWS